MPARPWRLPFICAENGHRLQIAEAFAHLRGGDRVETGSPGSRPAGAIQPPGPRDLGPEAFRAVRDETDARVRDLRAPRAAGAPR
jgi:hypothetical protein